MLAMVALRGVGREVCRRLFYMDETARERWFDRCPMDEQHGLKCHRLRVSVLQCLCCLGDGDVRGLVLSCLIG